METEIQTPKYHYFCYNCNKLIKVKHYSNHVVTNYHRINAGYKKPVSMANCLGIILK